MKRIGLVLAACLLVGTAEAATVQQGTALADTQPLVRAFYEQVSRCWGPPKSGADTVVQLEIRLDPDGRLVGEPELKSKFEVSTPATEESIMRAKAALYACAPYKLPPVQYPLWRDIIVTFDPRML